MLIYDAHSPAPRCLRMFLLEKRLQLPAVTVDVTTGENRQLAYLTVNPAGQTPALRLDVTVYWQKPLLLQSIWKSCIPYRR